MICERDSRPWLPASTSYWFGLDGLREVRLTLPDDLTEEEVERLAAAIHEHRQRFSAT